VATENDDFSLPTQGVADAVATAGMTDEERQARLDEEAEVRKFFKQFNSDQEFDKPIREQIRKDRQYASGEAVTGWAVSTNLIGSAIDVQTATLYARDPDVSVRPAAHVDPPPDPMLGIVPPQPERQRNQDMAKSLELVLSTLWKKGKLKVRMRRVIRSILSASHGWLKVLPATQMQPDPLAQNEYNTLQENVANVAAQITALEQGQTIDGQTASVEDLQVQKKQLETSLEALSSRLEVETCYGFTFDVVKPENMQVGTDVELLEEYLDADSLTEVMYFPHDQLREKFPDLTDKDLQSAEKYYRQKPVNANKGEVDKDDGALAARMYPNQGTADELYTTNQGEEGARPFAKVLEKWNKVDGHIYTAVCGVKVWARKPYQPSWASSRFYPFFYFSLNEVDGSRCPQSMASRGSKLQDEYASVRSNLRLVRRRSLPGVIADGTAFSDEELSKLTSGQIAEITALRPTMPGQDFSKAFAPKPIPNLDMRLFDTSPILLDLERTFGLSDTQQQAKNVETTATEEEIKAASANTRTSTWRDMIETVLSEMAQYCAEVALQKIPPHIAAKIAGPAVYWPHGMSVEDLTSLVEVSISAGTTGKPRSMGDREAWGVILPQLVQNMQLVAQLEATGQGHIAAPIKEVIRETMRRFGDESDLSRFLPQIPAQPGMPGMPAAPGALPPDAAGAPLPPDTAAEPAPPTEAVNPMEAGMQANGFFGPN
jgi:hypothetical protein